MSMYRNVEGLKALREVYTREQCSALSSMLTYTCKRNGKPAFAAESYAASYIHSFYVCFSVIILPHPRILRQTTPTPTSAALDPAGDRIYRQESSR